MSASVERSMSACPGQEENLVLLHYGDLGAPETRDVRAHLESCAVCAGYLKELRTLLPLTIAAAEPTPAFWNDYDRELRRKIDAVAESKSWTQKLADFFQPRWVPVFATAVMIALALTFTLGRGVWGPGEREQEEAAIFEIMPVAENLEFFNAMEVLDHLDVLESMGSQGNAA
jgi:hypothetical protein